MRFVLNTPKRANQSTHDVYNGSKKVLKKEEKTKRYSLPQTDPNQSMKSTMNINLSTTYIKYDPPFTNNILQPQEFCKLFFY